MADVCERERQGSCKGQATSAHELVNCLAFRTVHDFRKQQEEHTWELAQVGASGQLARKPLVTPMQSAQSPSSGACEVQRTRRESSPGQRR